ncbi:MAG: hypothetical protein NTU83_09675 [Candidatus Hydrogenedentes bacterium]|nr:hypothetical protein [Candidatus Hydrogenedentota bacterium]
MRLLNPSSVDYSRPWPSPDSDLDGVTDDEELALGTDPYKMDSDGDGRIDGVEVHGGDPGAIGPTTPTDPLNPDTDGNGQKDGQEVFQGTDPNDPLSRMRQIMYPHG